MSFYSQQLLSLSVWKNPKTDKHSNEKQCFIFSFVAIALSLFGNVPKSRNIPMRQNTLCRILTENTIHSYILFQLLSPSLKTPQNWQAFQWDITPNFFISISCFLPVWKYPIAEKHFNEKECYTIFIRTNCSLPVWKHPNSDKHSNERQWFIFSFVSIALSQFDNAPKLSSITNRLATNRIQQHGGCDIEQLSVHHEYSAHYNRNEGEQFALLH